MELSEVVIRPGENPAEILLRKIIENKSLNNRDEYAHYRYEAYTKIEFDANNITDRFMERKIFEPFRFIFDYVDTSAINAKAYLLFFCPNLIGYLLPPLTQIHQGGHPRQQGYRNPQPVYLPVPG